MIDISSARVVVTIPPQEWFGGQDRRSAFAITRQLEERFGSTFYQFDTTPFTQNDVRAQRDAIADLQAFRPHLAITLANAGYGLVCAVEGNNGWANVFTDMLNIPLMMLWDHGLFAFPNLIGWRFGSQTGVPNAGVLRRISSVIDAPLMHHYPIDSGQVAEMRRIGMLHSDKVNTIPSMAYKPFLDYGSQPRARRYCNDVAFAGNILLSDQHQPKPDQSVRGRCRDAVLAAQRANPTTPAWKLVVREVEALSPADRAQAHLEYDDADFWPFANEVVGVHCQRQGRVQTLSSLKRRVAFYGEFADAEGVPRLKEFEFIDYKGCADFSTELPRVYAESRILVDMTNAAFINNCSTKPICCFAAGGFSLFDYRPDPIAHLGDDIEKVMFRNFDELNAKVDYFLTHESEREALADHLKDVIRRKCDFADSVYEPAVRILAQQAERGGVWSSLRDALSRAFRGGASRPLRIEE